MTNEAPPTHPGEHLAEMLEELGVSQYRLAKTVGVPAVRINDIVHCRRSITADTALRLGRALRMTPEFWLNLQRMYDLDLARRDGRRQRHRAAVRRTRPGRRRGRGGPLTLALSHRGRGNRSAVPVGCGGCAPQRKRIRGGWAGQSRAQRVLVRDGVWGRSPPTGETRSPRICRRAPVVGLGVPPLLRVRGSVGSEGAG